MVWLRGHDRLRVAVDENDVQTVPVARGVESALLGPYAGTGVADPRFVQVVGVAHLEQAVRTDRIQPPASAVTEEEHGRGPANPGDVSHHAPAS